MFIEIFAEIKLFERVVNGFECGLLVIVKDGSIAVDGGDAVLLRRLANASVYAVIGAVVPLARINV